MGRLRYLGVICLILFMVSHITPVSASGSGPTSYTVTYTINDRIEISQDAYLPVGTYLDLGLSQPQDLFVLKDRMYIADTGNRRILVVDLGTSQAYAVGAGILSEPTGVAADSEGRIYVADLRNEAAYRFSSDGILEFTFTRPQTPNYGRSQRFKPKKVAPADGGGVYMLSDGNVMGIVHMNGTGDFLGYFASNSVTIGLYQRLQDLFLTDEQKGTFLNRTPPTFGNIHRGHDGLVYSVNRGREVHVKKHSINGLDLFRNSEDRIQLLEPVDICVAEDGRIFVIQSNGRITEMTYDGYLIAAWGGSSNRSDRVGLFELPAGIGTDTKGNVYVLDEQRAFVQVFAPTPVQTNIHRALNAYNSGLYDISMELWEEVLKFNSNSFLAHLYMGRTYLQKTMYAQALTHFEIARIKSYYSVAYWEIRNIWLQNNLGKVLLYLILANFAYAVLKALHRRRRIFDPISAKVKGLLSMPIVCNILRLKYALHHPIDNQENIKYGLTGSVSAATLIYGMLFIILVLSQAGTGFIYSVNLADYSVANTFLYYAVIMGLFIGGNYYISAINDGNGTLKSIYIGTAYCFAPAILLMPFVIVFSNFATLNEAFLITASITVILSWCMINIMLMITEIHEYSFKDALFNIFMTLFFMGVVVLAASFAYLLLRQVWGFIFNLFTEVMLRAKAI